MLANDITGFAWDDANKNGFRDLNVIQGVQPDIVFVIDVSGSTNATFQGTTNVGNQNPTQDNLSNTILDAEILTFKSINSLLIDSGMGNAARVSIVAFNGFASRLDMDPRGATSSFSSTPLADLDGNGTLDVVQVLEGLAFGGVTDFNNALIGARDTLQSQSTPTGSGNVFFLSDGDAERNFTAVVDELRNTMQVNLRAWGVGSGAIRQTLELIDRQASIFTSPDQMLSTFQVTVGGPTQYTENGLASMTVYLDTNNNGQLDVGETSQITAADNPATTTVDETGSFSFTGLPPGQYVVRQVHDVFRRETRPSTNVNGSLGYSVTVTSTSTPTGVTFGSSANQAPNVIGTINNQNVLYTGASVSIPLSSVFSDPDIEDPFSALTFAATSSVPGVLSSISYVNGNLAAR